MSNKRVKPDYFKISIYAPEIVRQAEPGQFVHLLCQDNSEPLLRRPFSFHRINRNSFEILYKVVGQGTNLLAKSQKGDKIDVLGPLGNGFNLQLTTYNLQLILVAGGMGVAPLLALAEELVKSQRKKDIFVLIGAKNRRQILCVEDFQALGVKVKISTDDGSCGFKGPVTSLLKKILLTTHPVNSLCSHGTSNLQLTAIYACGPKPMLREIARLGLRLGFSCWGCLEENIACGVGACLGCAIKTKQGYKLVCKDGPVFDLQEIRW